MDETYTPPTPTHEQTSEKSFDQHVAEALEQANASSSQDLPTLELTPEPGSVSYAAEAARRRFSPLQIGGAVVLGGMLATGVGGILASEGGSSNGAERGTVDNTIEAITLSPDANVRFDPYVSDASTNTEALQLDTQVTINVNHDIRVLEGTDTGTWYGIPVSEMQTVVPGIASAHDKDGIVWVNEQGVHDLKTTQLPTE